MRRSQPEVRQTLGSAGRLWSAPQHHQVGEGWWVACSGEMNVNYNVAFSQSPDAAVLVDCCLQPMLDLRKPGIIMLAGAGLGSAQKLAEIGWVVVGALPLMTLDPHVVPDLDGTGIRALAPDDLPAARALLSDVYGLDDGSARAAVPDRALESPDMGAWGLFDGPALASCFTGVVEAGLFVVWSMATRRESQGLGYGHRLLQSVLNWQFDAGVSGSLLQSSGVGQSLYLSLGYSVVEHWQLWSRPRWVMANA